MARHGDNWPSHPDEGAGIPKGITGRDILWAFAGVALVGCVVGVGAYLVIGHRSPAKSSSPASAKSAVASHLTPTTERLQVCALSAFRKANIRTGVSLSWNGDPYACFQGWGIVLSEQPEGQGAVSVRGGLVFRDQGYGWSVAGIFHDGSFQCGADLSVVPYYVAQQFIVDLHEDPASCQPPRP